MTRHHHPASGFNERLVDIVTAAAVGDEDAWRDGLRAVLATVQPDRLDEMMWLITWAAAEMCADLLASADHNVPNGFKLDLRAPGPTAQIAEDVAANTHALLQAARSADGEGGVLLWHLISGVDGRTWTMLATLSALTACFAIAYGEETS